MPKTREAILLDIHDVTGNIDRVIEYLTGIKKALESQGHINIQFHINHDVIDGIIIDISSEV